MKKLNKVQILKLIAFVIVVGICIYATIYLYPTIKNITTPEGQIKFKNEITNSGIKGMLMLFYLEIAQIILAVLPGEPLEVLAGMCYGSIGGTIFIMCCVFISTTVIFYLVRKFGKNLVYEFCSQEKIDKIENSKIFNDPKKIEKIMCILFLIPGTPKDLLVYIGGLLPIKPSRFILISTFVRFPSVISSTIVGNSIINGKWANAGIVYLLTLVFVTITILIINIFDKNKEAKKALNIIK